MTAKRPPHDQEPNTSPGAELDGPTPGHSHTHGGHTHGHGGPMHSHAGGGIPHSHGGVPHVHGQTDEPLYRGYPARVSTTGRVYHGIGVDIPPGGRPMMETLRQAFAQPFKGITADGTVQPGLFPLQKTGASTRSAVAAARAYLNTLKRKDFRRYALQPMDSPDRRRWINAFPDWMPTGVYLRDLEQDELDAALAVMEASLSAYGYEQMRNAMKINEALGQFINRSKDSMCEFGFFFTLFGDPTEGSAWGWRLTGFHLVMYCTFIGDQMVLTPTFVGAEMAVIEDGPYAGVSVLQEEQRCGLELATSLNAAQRGKAVLYPSMLSKDLPPQLSGLDGRHIAVAGQDNRVIPYQGVPATDLSKGQRDQLLSLINLYVGRSPEPYRALQMAEITKHLDETHFAWIGDPEKLPFYYRIHNPLILIEFDHHSGIFLANNNPEPFHIHTITRTPNGNDYGEDLLRQHYEAFKHS
ncbi:MAG: DUF3500 domain-containing protein [Steroidobacteraceae bacterium]